MDKEIIETKTSDLSQVWRALFCPASNFGDPWTVAGSRPFLPLHTAATVTSQSSSCSSFDDPQHQQTASDQRTLMALSSMAVVNQTDSVVLQPVLGNPMQPMTMESLVPAGEMTIVDETLARLVGE